MLTFNLLERRHRIGPVVVVEQVGAVVIEPLDRLIRVLNIFAVAPILARAGSEAGRQNGERQSACDALLWWMQPGLSLLRIPLRGTARTHGLIQDKTRPAKRLRL